MAAVLAIPQPTAIHQQHHHNNSSGFIQQGVKYVVKCSAGAPFCRKSRFFDHVPKASLFLCRPYCRQRRKKNVRALFRRTRKNKIKIVLLRRRRIFFGVLLIFFEAFFLLISSWMLCFGLVSSFWHRVLYFL